MSVEGDTRLLTEWGGGSQRTPSLVQRRDKTQKIAFYQQLRHCEVSRFLTLPLGGLLITFLCVRDEL